MKVALPVVRGLHGSRTEEKATEAQRQKKAEVTQSLAAGAMPQLSLQPLSLSLNIDRRTLAQAISTAFAALYGFLGQAPAADGMGQFNSGDHNFPAK